MAAVAGAAISRFNNNIRCIEITEPKVDEPPQVQFNNNIRCIEIY